ncbi:hypothetical protein L485_08015 [Sphingobium baderi LL03]|uniref:Uncharacterized protein n=1 Tax=Sphingobium baderi LL03 TaxID=1114964 RepID=T0HT15_9SPHN|nr:hypothetical protein L485_08015 [Sphingobium baderi LL03]
MAGFQAHFIDYIVQLLIFSGAMLLTEFMIVRCRWRGHAVEDEPNARKGVFQLGYS